MKACKTVMSIGYGRLHLMQSAVALADSDLDVKVVCGWVPRDSESVLVKICSRLIGRNLALGLRKRMVVEHEHLTLKPSFFVEAVGLVVFKLLNRDGTVSDYVKCVMWTFWGLMSRRYIKDAQVFHVRSGAGQGGGAIRAAKKKMKVLVDHSALHPATSEESLRVEYARWGGCVDSP